MPLQQSPLSDLPRAHIAGGGLLVAPLRSPVMSVSEDCLHPGKLLPVAQFHTADLATSKTLSSQVVDFQWHPSGPYTIMSVSEDQSGSALDLSTCIAESMTRAHIAGSGLPVAPLRSLHDDERVGGLPAPLKTVSCSTFSQIR